MIYYTQHTTSTNDELRNGKYGHFDILWAEQQSAGRGQRGHSWHSAEGYNLTFSVLLTPTFLPIIEQFLLSEVVALALVDTMADYNIECRIKWTNDIYAEDRKIVGVLIEHSLCQDHLMRTIVGVGLNVNQRDFPEELPNPTSMANERGTTFDREVVLSSFETHLQRWYNILESGNKQYIEEHYRQRMYHLDEPHTYAYASGEQFVATIRGVAPSGELCLEHSDGRRAYYAFKEVEFVLPHKSNFKG